MLLLDIFFTFLISMIMGFIGYVIPLMFSKIVNGPKNGMFDGLTEGMFGLVFAGAGIALGFCYSDSIMNYVTFLLVRMVDFFYLKMKM